MDSVMHLVSHQILSLIPGEFQIHEQIIKPCKLHHQHLPLENIIMLIHLSWQPDD